MGRYGEVKSAYLGKFKGHVSTTNVIVYQQTGSRAIEKRIHSVQPSTTQRIHHRYTPPRATNTSPSTHTYAYA